MTIDEEIAMMHEWADYDCYNEEQIQASEAFNRIAEWLEELKAYRNHVFSGEMTQSMLKEERNKAIDDFVKACKENIMYKTFGLRECDIEQIAKQLKAGGENENA